MVPIGGEAFVYILIICIRLNRNYHLELTNGSRVPGRGSQGHSSSAGTMGKLYLTKCQEPAQN